jgi:flavin-dependent thymidylate synthase
MVWAQIERWGRMDPSNGKRTAENKSMRVILAGYNVDLEALRLARDGMDPRAAEQLTPETLAAAYARISRNPAPVDELRRQARQEVAKARASNEQIIFGFGHASVAEHAVFNFDLIGVSRLAIEAVEHSRLCSYTEKSQRYIRLRDDHVIPEELTELGLRNQFEELVGLQNRTYHLLYEKLRELVFGENRELAADKSNRRLLEGWAKEDARYVTALATEGQLGMTLNARSLEQMIRRLAAHPLHEAREISQALRVPAGEVAPSLVRHTEPSAAQSSANLGLREVAERHLGQQQEQQTLPGATGAVQLVAYTADPDLQTLAALLHSVSSAPWTVCYSRACALGDEARAALARAAFVGMGPHDSAPRALEQVSFKLDLVVSAACFGQLKRHRMASLLVQPYDPALGYTAPKSVERIGMNTEIQRVMAESTRFYEKVVPHHPAAAAYALTQAHRRRVLMTINARELYHFARLRQDAHAQWDIRALADRILYLCRQVAPLTLLMACGKDTFDAYRAEVYGS